MLKLLGACCMIGGCGYLGLQISSNFSRRVRLLQVLQNGLTMLETEINFTATPLPLAMQRVGEKLEGEAGSLFLRTGKKLVQYPGFSAGEAWDLSIGELCRLVPLTKEETAILRLFGWGLGVSAKEEQIKNIALAKEQLAEKEKAALEARGKNERMWRYLGFCTGAIAVLMLL